jgi:hypothetical protein
VLCVIGYCNYLRPPLPYIVALADEWWVYIVEALWGPVTVDCGGMDGERPRR